MDIISGVVARGKGRGRKLGFPTINITLAKPMPGGIYAGKVVVAGEMFPAAVFVNQKETLLEAYLLDFDRDLYGQTVQVLIHEKMRDILYFKNDDELILKIAEDVRAVRARHGKAKS